MAHFGQNEAAAPFIRLTMCSISSVSMKDQLPALCPDYAACFVPQYLDKPRQKAHEKRLEEKAKALQRTSEEKFRKQKRPDKAASAEKRAPAAKRRLLEDRQDVTDFASDYTLLKKLKNGKLSEVNFDGALLFQFSCGNFDFVSHFSPGQIHY